MTRRVERPIFIIGTGRCGSTVFHQMMARHPQVAYLTGTLVYWPARRRWNRLAVSLREWPLVGSIVRRRVIANEAWPFWERHAPGFTRPCRDLRAEDVTHQVRRALHGVFSRIVSRRRPRLLIKLTGWPRIGFVKEVFPDARIIHVVRDPRAVVNSWLNVYFWEGWQGPGQWHWGPLDENLMRIWRKHDESFPVLAAIGYKKIMDAYEEALERLGAMRGDVMEVRYDDLCASTQEVVGRVIEFCALEDTPRFRAAVAQFTLVNRDEKWRHNFPEVQQQHLEEALQSLQLDRYTQFA